MAIPSRILKQFAEVKIIKNDVTSPLAGIKSFKDLKPRQNTLNYFHGTPSCEVEKEPAIIEKPTHLNQVTSIRDLRVK